MLLREFRVASDSTVGLPDAREDDSSNMSRAQEFVLAGLAAHIQGFTVVDICQRNIFSRQDATPTKRMKLRDTRTEMAVVMTEFAELAKLNSRNYLAQVRPTNSDGGAIWGLCIWLS
jgi:hypothetical protein